MTNVFQFTIGSGNKSLILENDGKPQPLSAVLEKLYGLFKEEDHEINTQISGGVTTTKTNECSPFRSDKILASLIKIGLPLDLTVKVLEMVINDIQSLVTKTHVLSTKEIRRFVADAIRNIESVDKFEAEEWSYRYTRKYGHDSRRIVICNHPIYGNVEISYPLIHEIIKDAFSKVIPVKAVEGIPRRQLDNIACYVVEFVNGCDVYYFDYELLQKMVIEMACQPPHPWLITDKTRDLLYEYDIEAIQSNIVQTQKAEITDESSLKYCCYEIVHHASSLILEKYKWFLGLDDFTSFYILKDLVNKYNQAEFSVILSLNDSMQKLERDLSLIGESIDSMYSLLSEVEKIIKGVSKLDVPEIGYVIRYGKLAIGIVTDNSAEHIIEIIKSNWSGTQSSDILSTISKVFGTLTHASNSHKPNIEMNLFRFVFKPLDIAGNELKKQYLIVYVDKNFDYDRVTKKLCGAKYTDQASVILVLSSDDMKTQEISECIDEKTNGSYWCLPLLKTDLIELLESDNPAMCFHCLIEGKIKAL